ncbi:hypothetical protein LRR18_17825, partial [Mangrovimonas sp. AS39]|uniref:hypothetical protein n=1 Tax=Mangrovimonas futianensis TaxID=2895523 RepID=UPI001E63CA9F
ERLWAGALLLMRDWECELIPNPKELDLGKETNPQITQVIAWASWKVKTTIDEMQEVPKN